MRLSTSLLTWKAHLRIHNLRVHRVCTLSEQQEQYFGNDDHHQLEIFWPDWSSLWCWWWNLGERLPWSWSHHPPCETGQGSSGEESLLGEVGICQWIIIWSSPDGTLNAHLYKKLFEGPNLMRRNHPWGDSGIWDLAENYNILLIYSFAKFLYQNCCLLHIVWGGQT